MKYWAVRWALAGAWLVFACGSAQNGGPGSQGSAGAGGSTAVGHISGEPSNAPPIELQDLCPIFTHDLCTYLMQCAGARYRDAAHCERELTCFGLPQLTAAAERGAVDYDPSKVGQCHAQFAQSPCSFGFFLYAPDIYNVLQFCPGTVTPKLKSGDSCAANGECSAGLYCDKGATAACPGTCTPFRQQGEDCGDNGRCADGLRCDSDSSQCVPVDAAGSSCANNCSYSVSCPVDEVCPSNIWCDREEWVCKTGRLEGEPCGTIGAGAAASVAQCAVNLWCDALPFDTGSCRKPSAQGGPCTNQASTCAKGLHCVGYEPFHNSATLGTCQPPGPAGSECGALSDCNEGLTCATGHCQPPAAADAPCTQNSDCQIGLICLDDKCTVAHYPGDRCGPEGTDACTLSRCVNGTCDYHANVGEACAAPTDCATGSCVAGVCYDNSVCRAPT